MPKLPLSLVPPLFPINKDPEKSIYNGACPPTGFLLFPHIVYFSYTEFKSSITLVKKQ